ncbi:UvrD-helicase domain-containing protein [Reichenbachiella carrageenanivorans]|uniref:DNA 3'-5' helicase n=1 Tax=Reichenbachiella carrageenanivorans TaxID=2979869 RepID=A0ABY6D8G2_9BACT|nr:UvrD-helicase domain-containing protein [Reichenbachiella carrageenanivorans]
MYRASAGSGKTYILTYNYIRLALKYPDYFKTVLAVTFTNKATEEMKSRIQSTLKELAKGQNSMSADLMVELNINEQQLSERADALLKSILHNYSFFAVTTIDAFFQKIVRSFAREIGIQTGFKIELDQSKVISEVIDQMLADMANDPHLVKWLTDFAIYQINQGKSWDTRKDIKNLSGELFNEFLVLNKHKVFEQLSEPDFINNFIKSLNDRRTTLEQGMAAIGGKIKAILDRYGLAKDDFTQKARGVGGFFEGIAQGEFKDANNHTLKAIKEDVWYSKTSKTKDLVESAIGDGIQTLGAQALVYIEENGREYQSLNQVIKYIYTFGLLSRISDEINDYREEHDLLLISDFPVFLNEIINDSDAPYIYEKVGTRYKHYLIDEFQDTSGLQWNNFKPLIQDTLSAGNFSMVVGDIKQSIYRWRGGNWKILLDQIRKDIGENHIKDEGLSTNRRSKQNIVEFNNDLFLRAPELLENHLGGHIGEEIKASLNMQAAYDSSAQQLFDESGDGLIQLHFYEKDEEIDDVNQYVIDELVKYLQYLQKANYQLNDIAILVRTNPQGKTITKGLMEYQLQTGNDGYKYDIISNESLFIKNNPAVHLVLQSLLWLANPIQPLAKAQLHYACRQYGERTDAIWNPTDLIAKESELTKMNMSQMVEAIIHHFQLFNQVGDHAYLLAFQDLILDYLKYERDSLTDFLVWWSDHDTRSIQVSEDQEAIRLMTVHKSKGLQFKVVIVPFCQWSLDHGTNEQLLWCETNGAQVLEQVPYLPVRYKNDLAKTVFAKDFYLEKADVYLDSLNLLYVALTRAEEALYVMAPVKPFGNSMTSVADLLYQYAKDRSLLAEELVPVQIGKLPPHSEYPSPQEGEVSLTAYDFSPPADRIKLRQQAHILEEAVVESINYGQIIHWIFSLIRSKNDFTMALSKAQIKFGLSDQEMVDIKLKLREIWEIPQIEGWFDVSWQVKNESSILLTNGKLKRPDRVIVKDNRAIVIDYKTGARADGHLRQVQEYKNILGEMGYDQVDGYLIYLSEPDLLAV